MTYSKALDVLEANVFMAELYHAMGNTEKRDYLVGKCRHVCILMNNHKWQQEQ